MALPTVKSGNPQKLTSQVRDIKNTLACNAYADVGFAKVVMRTQALAKSHRPISSLLNSRNFPLMGGDGLGEMFFKVHLKTLETLEKSIEKAEDQTRWKVNDRSGINEPNPSRIRSEVGAIENIYFHSPSDRRDFSVDSAISWLSDERTGGAYLVSLFESYIVSDEDDTSVRKLYDSFRSAVISLGNGISTRFTHVGNSKSPFAIIRLEKSNLPPSFHFDSPVSSAPRKNNAPAQFDDSSDRHVALITLLDHHPLVRHINLPPIIEQSQSIHTVAEGSPVNIPPPAPQSIYPKIGIIDTGVETNMQLSPWCIGRSNLLDSNDPDSGHGTFIAGLLVAGSTLNNPTFVREEDSCQFFDLGLHTVNEAKYSQYYPGGPIDFFEQLELEIDEAKKLGVRIFNMSLSVLARV